MFLFFRPARSSSTFLGRRRRGGGGGGGEEERGGWGTLQKIFLDFFLQLKICFV